MKHCFSFILFFILQSSFFISSVVAQPHAAGYVRPHDEIVVPAEDVAVEAGTFEADWNNLSAWECPDWFRDAKFGIWAHWDPQCEAEDGDWYARSMYGSGNQRTTFYNYFGHYPSHDWGYKDFCRYWTVAQWNPEELIKLYADAGAKYFMAMGQHHDNYDCWDSPYQEWNSMNIGPNRDIVGEWAEQCRKYGLRLGVSMHGAHAWTFFEVGRDADTGVTKDEGTGTWWEGYDPQELYAQNHTHSQNWSDWGTIHNQWGWGNGVCPPSVAYMQKFQNRVLQCVNKYNPDMLYFDDTVLPFYGASTNTNDQYSLNILKHYYNHSAAQNDGVPQVVVTGKILEDRHKRAMLWDVERGIPDRCQDLPWQTCTCIGGWHYSKYEGDNNMYKSAETVIRMLVDIVSKNGNLLLSIPVRGNGTLDTNEKRIVANIKAWMDINGESIYGTRPWKVYGEGPLFDSANPLNAQGFNEGINYSDRDVRYVQRNDTVYATIMRWPSRTDFTFKSLGKASAHYSGKVQSVKLLGYGDVDFTQDIDGLTIILPETHPNEIAPVVAITFDPNSPTTLTLQEVIEMYEQKASDLSARTSNNTGKPNALKVDLFMQQINEARNALAAGASEEEQTAAIASLHAAYNVLLQTGFNPAGSPDEMGQMDVTLDYLLERENFSATDMGSRFGRPVNWTVENFSIPQLDASKGTKNGIDNYPGRNCLMMGKWSGEDGTPATNMTNARIYRTVHLKAGHYSFYASFNALYQLGTSYIYVASEPLLTSKISKNAIAKIAMSQCANDGNFYGFSFTLDEDKDVIIAFQANMQTGNANQEFRVDQVKLLYCADPENLTQTDVTKNYLVQASAFSRVTGQSTSTRYGTPKNWTVENYRIPAGNDGTRNGLDRYPGYDCLTLGVWDDRQNSTEGDLAHARVYRKVNLDAGNYYFGAAYEANYQLNEAYIFAASELLPTSDIPQQSLAYDNISDAGKDNTSFRGVYFELPEAQEVILGFQADLASGAAEQEFRASKVKFVRFGVPDGIVKIGTEGTHKAIYDITGRQLPSARRGLNLIRTADGTVKKVIY
ncbi:MAG: alpha-L-fucosidase [Bacteroidaceae bacterium]|nr:alpha-L-fucosidase [Bacteroidaceae bacterium]